MERILTERLRAMAGSAPAFGGLVGFADFDAPGLDAGPGEAAGSGLSSVWFSDAGSAGFGCLCRFRRYGGIVVGRQQVVAHVGNLVHRPEAVQALADGDNRVIPNLNSIFALACWNPAGQEMVLVTERYNNLPLFYSWDGRRLVFGSEVKSILALVGNRREIDRQVLGEILLFGSPLAEGSLFAGIEKVPSATVLRFSRTGMTQEEYWRLRYEPARPEDGRTVMDQALDAFQKAVGRACEQPRTALALTGGLDTRLVLASAVNQSLSVAGFTTGVADCAELEVATKLGQHLTGPHHRLVAGPEYLNAFAANAEETVALTEGRVLLGDSHVLFQSRWCAERLGVIVDGGYGELTKRGPLKRVGRRLMADEPLSRFLLRHLGNRRLAGLLLEPAEMRELEQRVRSRIDTIEAQTRQTEGRDRIDAFFLRAVWPNSVNSQAALQNEFLEGRLPYLDYEFIDAVTRFRLEWREQARFQLQGVKRLVPELQRYGRVFANMVVPWTDNTLLKYALPAMNLLGVRLGMRSRARPSFPYSIWWRNALLPFVRELLEALDQRRLFPAGRVTGLLKPEVMAGSAFDQAASVLGMLELWLRCFADRSPALPRHGS